MDVKELQFQSSTDHSAEITGFVIGILIVFIVILVIACAVKYLRTK